MKPLSLQAGRLLRWAAIGLAALALTPALAQQSQAITPPKIATPRPPVIAVPRLVVADARIPVRVEQVAISTDIVGLTAQTRIELVFHNPNAQILEGELQFPLAPSQTVTGFALDINGELRPAVPVEKVKGRQVFEEVTRRRVDPALLEVTQGNNYKLRVYPLPANGTRRVVLNIAESLTPDASRKKHAVLNLPLDFGGRVAHYTLSVRIADTPTDKITVVAPGIPADALRREQRNGAAWVVATLDGRETHGMLRLEVPDRDKPVVTTQTVAGRRYFYAELPFAAWSAPRPAPRKLALLWDASGSAGTRDHGREMQLLDAYLKALGNVDVVLSVARDTVEPPRSFAIRNGDWHSLQDALEATPNDGASNLGALQVPSGCDLALLFSDGLSNWRERGLPTSKVPLYAISSTTGTDTARLRALAEGAGGELIDLLNVAPREAVSALRTQRGHLLALRGLGASELVTASVYPERQRLLLAGVLTGTEASVDVELNTPAGGVETRRIAIADTPRAQGKTPTTIAATRWASLKLAQLEPDYNRNQSEIRRIGKTFGLVTRETSLIVLDTVQDYARYEIEPPATLRDEYERLLASQRSTQTRSRSAQLDQLAHRFAQRAAWWERDFPKGDKPMPKEKDLKADDGRTARREMLRAAPPPSPAPATAAPMRERTANLAQAVGDVASEAAPAKSVADKKGSSAPSATPMSITLKKWEPDAPYAKRLRAAAPDALYQAYLDERPSYTQSTAFFLDAADIFFEKGQPALGIRVLSNLAEMNLENRAILRILAYRLLQAKQIALAIPVLQQVVKLAPDEPQSYRDLGLAYADGGQLKEASDQLWEVVSRPWDGRFADIDLIALSELNAVIAKAQRDGTPLDTSRFDARLLRNLPLDVRVVLSWDADNTDIDLWVEDPNHESVYYGNNLSYQGGHISRDMTQGYGPEEFALRKAKAGGYTVYAKFFGHRQQIVAGATTVMMRLTTGFGTAAQKDEFITLRLTERGDRVTVGSFTVNAPANGK